MSFKIGDVVALKSGSPLMTVTGVNNAEGGLKVSVTWFVGGEPKWGAFPAAALVTDPASRHQDD